MHEMGLAEGILVVVLDVAEGRKVRRVQLQVGKLHQVVPDSLQFSFDLVSNETAAEKASLDLRETPIIMRCERCNTESEFGVPPFACIRCGGFDLHVVSGDEFLVNEIEMEDGEIVRRTTHVHEDESVPHTHE